jgi:hypothetical protein
MAFPDAPAPDPPPPATPAAPRRSRAAGCAFWGAMALITLSIAFGFLVGGRWFTPFPPLPELLRPTAVLQGAADLDRGSPSAQIEAELLLDDGAVAAMQEGDGLVHLELDVEAVPEVDSLVVGVNWASRAEVLRALEPLPLDQDVRWTLECTDAADCRRTIAIRIELPDDEADTEVTWRLVADVRPPREAEVPEVAVVQLIPVEGSE